MHLPQLDDIQIASPCRERWREMTGDDRVRTCAKCEKKVYNFASLTREEIADLILKTEGTLCVRLFRRRDGTILTADCPEGRAERLHRLLKTVAATAVFIVVSGLAVGLVSWLRSRGVLRSASSENVAVHEYTSNALGGRKGLLTFVRTEASTSSPSPVLAPNAPSPAVRPGMRDGGH